MNEFGYFCFTVRKYLKLEISSKKTNSFVRFLGESMARKSVYGLISPLVVKKYVLWKVNFDGTLKKANRVCSLTLSLCSVRDPCFTFIQFGAHRLLHFESFLYKVPKTKAEAGNSTLSYAMVFDYLFQKYTNLFFFSLTKKELSFWKTKDFLISSANAHVMTISRYRISSYSFRPWIVSSLEYFPHIYVLWPLDFQIQERKVSVDLWVEIKKCIYWNPISFPLKWTTAALLTYQSTKINEQG